MAVIVGCTSSDSTSTTSVPSTAPATSVETTTAFAPAPPEIELRPRTVAPFAALDLVPLAVDTGPYQGLEWPASLDGVIRQPWTIPSEQAAAALLEHGFVVVPSRGELFHPLYQSYDAEQVWFVTSDVGYHFWHLAFDKVLREVETQYLLPTLEDLVAGLLDAARLQHDELTGTDLEGPADRVVQLMEATITLLEREAGSIGPLASQEVELALTAIEKTASPVTSFAECMPAISPANCVDYSLFRPRGHYTRSADLERYFRAMSSLGQSSFFLGDPDAADWDHRSLQLGLLTARLFAFDDALGDAWATIYEPTAFMVGLADDFTPFELLAAAESVAPGIVADPTGADAEVVEEVARALAATRPVAIDPEAAAVRIMGARFVIDAFVLDQMVRPHVGTLEDPRLLGSPLDLAATLGSELAYTIQDEAGETDFENYDAQLDEMAQLMNGRSQEEWSATVYDAWLWALQPKLAEHGEQFPAFMRSEEWTAKDLQTALGSYAELKHDTILYAKQSSAAEGGFTPLAEPARHWVETDPVAFGRLAAVARMLQDGLQSRDLIGAPEDRLLTDLVQTLDRLSDIARDELAGLPISDDDNSWLDSIGSVLESLWFQSADLDDALGDVPRPDDQESAIISDIQSSAFEYLEIGTGWVDRILVLVPNDSGRFQVASGAVYSYYEFARPRSDQRLTDDEWREMLRSDQQPPRPTWQQVFLPESTGGEGLLSLGGGLLCRDVAAAGYLQFDNAVAYWLREGRPDRMDADLNGIPCETVYEPFEIEWFFEQASRIESGLSCGDLAGRTVDFRTAVAYWLLEGMPARMDADLDDLPCETVYDSGEVDRFVRFERG
jgi:hypothetical protein